MSYTPENLLYVMRPEETVHNFFTRTWRYRNHKHPEATERFVRPTFVVDAENPQTRKTAVDWAKGNYRYRAPTPGTAEIVELPNTPISHVELVTLEVRSQGGRAWKVLIEDTYYVDLREDTLLDVLLYGRGHEEGVIVGPFIWVCVGSSVKLLTYGGHEHKQIIDEEQSAQGVALAAKRRATWAKQAAKDK